MNKEQTAERIKVMQAYVDGKRIQYRYKFAGNDWRDFEPDEAPHWDWNRCDFRIKPEPREWMMVVDKHTGQLLPMQPHNNVYLETVRVREIID